MSVRRRASPPPMKVYEVMEEVGTGSGSRRIDANSTLAEALRREEDMMGHDLIKSQIDAMKKRYERGEFGTSTGQQQGGMPPEYLLKTLSPENVMKISQMPEAEKMEVLMAYQMVGNALGGRGGGARAIGDNLSNANSSQKATNHRNIIHVP